MKLLKFAFIISVFTLCFVSCGGDDEEDTTDTNSASGQSCESNFDCPLGYTCDPDKKICTDGSDNGGNGGNGGGSGDGGNGGGNGDGGDNGNNGDESDTGPVNHDDQGPITGNCNPGDTQFCDYQGPAGTEGIGPCKAAKRTCQEDGTWGKCVGGYEPVPEIGELCSNEIDDDCDGIVDNGTDFDDDGHGSCTDCCESTDDCPAPSQAWDNSIPSHICEYSGEISYNCDSEIEANSTDPVDYAKAIGLCKTTTEDSSNWGLISAKITAPNGDANVHAGSNGLLSKLGNVIKPQAGNLMLGLSSGTVSDPFVSNYSGATTGAPSDWLAANGGKFPSAPGCNGSSGTSGTVNDAVMLEMRIRTPKTAKSFSFNLYFLTIEYPSWICSSFNDFFVALLDSTHTSSDPTLQNPADKNLAMDANGNPVGVNLAPSGLFTQCSPVSSYPATQTSCVGTEDLVSTGFESHGGTGWLTTRGNVVGGEVITLRLATWDLGDHALDSLVLIDNFTWEADEYKPGTGQY